MTTLATAATELYQDLCDHKWALDGESALICYVDDVTGYLMGECRICGAKIVKCKHEQGTYEDTMYAPATDCEPAESWIVDRCKVCDTEIKPEYKYSSFEDSLPY